MRVFRLPAVRERLADNLDLARFNISADHFHHAFQQECGVRVTGVALDDGIVARRNQRGYLLCDDRADTFVVKGQIEGARIFDQAVIANHRDAFGSGAVDCRPDRIFVPGVDDQGVCTLCDQGFDVGQLLGGRGLGIGRNIGVTSGFDRGDHRSFVDLPALFLKAGPGHTDFLAVCHCGGRQARSRNDGQHNCITHIVFPPSGYGHHTGRSDECAGTVGKMPIINLVVKIKINVTMQKGEKYSAKMLPCSEIWALCV